MAVAPSGTPGIPFSPDPVSLGIAGVTTALNLIQGDAAQKAKQQDYLNQVAFQNVNSEFNQWQATFNASTQNLNSQYQHWAKTVDYNQNLAHVQQLRNFEFAKELEQAKRVGQTRASAGANFVVNSAAIQQQLQERGMQEAVAIQQYAYRALQGSAAFQAGMQEGKSSDRYVNDFARQVGDFTTLKKIGEGLRNRQYRRDQMAAVTRYLNEYNSQTFYEKTPYMDPIAPFPPLPTMVTPPPPSMTGGAPASNGFLNAASSVMSGVGTYLDTASSIKKLAG
jgi:hypothetical protein